MTKVNLHYIELQHLSQNVLQRSIYSRPMVLLSSFYFTPERKARHRSVILQRARRIDSLWLFVDTFEISRFSLSSSLGVSLSLVCVGRRSGV